MDMSGQRMSRREKEEQRQVKSKVDDWIKSISNADAPGAACDTTPLHATEEFLRRLAREGGDRNRTRDRPSSGSFSSRPSSASPAPFSRRKSGQALRPPSLGIQERKSMHEATEAGKLQADKAAILKLQDSKSSRSSSRGQPCGNVEKGSMQPGSTGSKGPRQPGSNGSMAAVLRADQPRSPGQGDLLDAAESEHHSFNRTPSSPQARKHATRAILNVSESPQVVGVRMQRMWWDDQSFHQVLEARRSHDTVVREDPGVEGGAAGGRGVKDWLEMSGETDKTETESNATSNVLEDLVAIPGNLLRSFTF